MNISAKVKKIQIILIRGLESQIPITIIGLGILYVGLLVFVIILHTIEIRTTAQLSQHWRGAYDLLLRPQMAITQVEKEHRIVEGNYLGAAQGGITEEQYERIKSMPDVEVAAPISVVGFMMNNLGSISVRIEPYLPNNLYEMKIGWYGDEAVVQEFPTPSAYFAESDDNFLFNDFLKGDLSFSGSGMVGDWVFLNIGSLPPQWILVAGIDPEAEAKLIGLDEAIEEGDYLQNEELKVSLDGSKQQKAVKIPLLVNRQSFINLGVEILLRTLPIQSEDVEKLKEDESNEVLREKMVELDQQGEVLIRQRYDLLSALRPLIPQSVVFSTNQPPQLEAEGGYIPLDSNIILRPGIFKYEFHEGSEDFPSHFSIKPYGNWEEIVRNALDAEARSKFDPQFLKNLPLLSGEQTVFRSLEAIKPLPFIPDVKGVYNIGSIIQRLDPLSYVPLGIYEPPQEVLVYDENGSILEPKLLSPGLNPGSFNPRPPLGLTTLEAAQYLVGRPDYIDAIRVRIRDISGYSSENVHKIERIATEIQEKTGLHVDIVAGASPQKILLYVPGIGYIEENWTSLGSTQYVESGVNLINLILLFLLLSGSILLIITNTNLFVLSKLPEIGLLKALGWENRYILRRLVKYISWITVWGIVPLTVLILFLSILLDLNISIREIVTIGSVVGGGSIVSSLPLFMNEVRKRSYHLLHFGETSIQRRNCSTDFTFSKLVLYQLRRRPRRYLVNGISIGLITFTFVSMIYIWSVNKGEVNLNLLGKHLMISLSPYYLLLTACSLLIGLLILVQNVVLNVAQRETEFRTLVYIGWDKKQLFRMVFYESFMRGGIFGVMGVLLGMIAISFWKGIPANFLGLNLSIFGVALALILIACWVGASKSLAYLRLPGVRSSIHRFKFGQILLLLLLFIGLVNYLGGNLIPITSLATVQTPLFTKSNGDLTIDENQMKEVIKELNGVMESAFPANDRNEIIAQKLLQKLSGMGVKVYEEWVPYQTAEIFDPQQNLMFQLLPYRMEGNPMTLVTSATHFKLASNLLNQKTPLIYSPVDQVIEVCDSLDQRWLMLAGHSREPVHFIHPVVELLEKKCALPMGIVGVALQDPAGISSDVKQVMEKNVEIKFYQARVLGATIRGSVYPEKEIWVTTHYDAREGTPAADLSLTGTVTLLELARQFAESGTPYTLRFIWLPGLASQYSGLIAYIQNHSTEIPSIVGVIDISQTGNWQYIAVDNDLSSSDINGQGIDIERVKTEGQYLARENWMMSINLDDPSLMDWLNGLLEKKMGLSESPEILRNSILKTGESFGVSIKSTNYTCPLSLSILLSANLPSIGLCGAGNELIGSPFDDISTIDMHKLSQFTSFSYVALQNLMDEMK